MAYVLGRRNAADVADSSLHRVKWLRSASYPATFGNSARELPVGLCVVGVDGMISALNARAADLFGADPQSLMGRPLSDCMPNLDELYSDLLDSDPDSPRGGVRTFWQLQARNREPVEILVEVSRIHGGDASASSSYFVELLEITPWIQLRSERDRLMQLAAVGETLPTLLHELKNPLAAISTTIEVILEELDPGELQNDMHGILGEVRRVVLSCDGLGTVGRTMHSESFGAVDLAVRDAFRILEPRARSKGIQVLSQVANLPLLPLDISVMRAIVFNLTNNAIHACRADDTISLTANLINGGTLFELVLSDTGVGMAEAVRKQCTELFYSTKTGGSGIGLALCQQVVDEAGGQLEVQSTQGKGTRIRIAIPLPKHHKEQSLQPPRRS